VVADEQYAMAEFLALVAIGSVGVTQDGRPLLTREGPDGPVPMPAPELEPMARLAAQRGWTVEAARRVGLAGPGRAALRHLRANTNGVVPDDPDYHQRVMRHDVWMRQAAPQAFGVHREPGRESGPLAAPSAAPAPPPPTGPPPGHRGGSLLFTPAAPGPSWVVELARADPAALRSALSAEQAAELRATLGRVLAALG
jgi:hypothetical protein